MRVMFYIVQFEDDGAMHACIVSTGKKKEKEKKKIQGKERKVRLSSQTPHDRMSSSPTPPEHPLANEKDLKKRRIKKE